MLKKFRNTGLTGFAILLAMVVSMPLPVFAQSFYGSIVGSVTDSSGGAIPGAKVTATDVGTNTKKTADSDSAGNFSFFNLVPAVYTVEVEKENFKRFRHERTIVEVGKAIRTDAVLEVGAATEVVEVTSASPLLQTESSALSQEVSGKTVQEMPLNGRNTMNLIALAAGVVPQGSSMGTTALNNTSGSTTSGGWGNYQIGGNIAGQGASYVDGAPINTLGNNSVGLVPTQDSVQEFAVTSNNVGAEFGRYGGGVVNMTTKSGSNKWHGSAYEYLRNTSLNANDFYNKNFQTQVNVANKPVKLNQNQYGAVFSGPILKDKAFFLLSWEGFKARKGYPSPALVPSVNMQNGIIPEVWTKTVVAGVTTYTQSNSGLGTPYAGNACSIQHTVTGTGTAPGYYTVTNLNACINPTTKIMKQYWGAPTVINGVQYTDPTGSNYYREIMVADDQNQYTGRFDFNASANQRIFGRYTYWNIKDSSFNQFPSSPYNVGSPAMSFNTHQLVLGDTYTIDQRNILDVRLSILRGENLRLLPNMNVDESIFGGEFAQLGTFMKYDMYPMINFSASRGGVSGPYSFFSNFGSGYSAGFSDTYSLSANLIHMMGRHTLKFGAEARRMDNPALAKTDSGQYTFDGTATSDAWADLLSGYTTAGQIAASSWTTAFNFYQAYYAQDTWQFNRKLTLNFGVRWELPGGMFEQNDKNTVLMPDAIDPYTGVKGTMGLVNDPLGSSSRSSLQIRHNLFAPNLGFAYRLGSNMVVRGGYGLSYLPSDMGTAAPGAASINSAQPQYSLVGKGAKPFKVETVVTNFGGTLVQPQGRANFSGTTGSTMGRIVPAIAANATTNQGSISAGLPSSPYGYMQQWNASISRQMKGDWMMEANYAGTKGTHLASLSGVLNQLDPAIAAQYSGTCLVADAKLCPTKYAQTTSTGITQYVTLGQSKRPYPFYTGYTDTNSHWGASIYHALQVRTQKRFKTGGLIMANYTWSKTIGDTDTNTPGIEVKSTPTGRDKSRGELQNNYDHAAERSIMSYNMPQRLVVSYVMPLPFGKGRRFAQWNGVAGKLVGGWAVNGITTLQTGFPISIMDSTKNYWTSYGAGTIRPNEAVGCKKTVDGSAYDRQAKWFNVDCFSSVASATGSSLDAATNSKFSAFGNAPRVDGTLRMAGIANWDFSVLKSTQLTERVKFEFRGEFFNVFNRTQFAPPAVSLATLGFGAVKATANTPRYIQFSGRLSF